MTAHQDREARALLNMKTHDLPMQCKQSKRKQSTDVTSRLRETRGERFEDSMNGKESKLLLLMTIEDPRVLKINCPRPRHVSIGNILFCPVKLAIQQKLSNRSFKERILLLLCLSFL